MSRTELVSMIGQLREYQVEQIRKMAEELLIVREELSDTTPKSCPAATMHRHASLRRGFLAGSSGISVWLAERNSPKEERPCLQTTLRFMYSWGTE